MELKMNDENKKIPKVFISYSHDNLDHKKWIYKFACELINSGIDVFLDQFDVRFGDDLTKYMESSVNEADRVLMICTEKYVKKADTRSGGVGYEAMVVSGELINKIGTRKFIPIIKQKLETPVLPKAIATRMYVDFSNESEFSYNKNMLINEIYNIPEFKKPPLGKGPKGIKTNDDLPSDSQKNITPKTISEPLGWDTTVGTKCPSCENGKLVFSHYDIGPFSRSSEYYRCDSCETEFPTVIPYTGATY